MSKKIEIPKEVVDGGLDVIEKELFPKPAKTIWGKIARIGVSVLRIFVSGKSVKLKL